MKKTKIKKILGNGTLVWAECFRGEEPEVVVHHPDDIEYEPMYVYVFEAFIKKDGTNSKIIKALCERYSADKVFAYQKCYVGTNGIDASENTMFAEIQSGDSIRRVFDCDCSYLISVKKSMAEQIPFDGESFFIQNN